MAGPTLDEILARLRSTQAELDLEVERLLAEGRERFRYTLDQGRVVFERQMQRLHLGQRTGIPAYLRTAPIAFILSSPLIYGMIVPLLFLDLSLTLYQKVCFRIYGIPPVRRGDYLVIDRHRLAYLNGIEKLNCVYCGYANQLIEYAREITGRTEQFWCPIKHAQRTQDPHPHTNNFVDYGDADAYARELPRLRKTWPEDSASRSAE